jgi:hypothetical protein
MEMVGKQFSPFMEMVVQPCLTACAIASYIMGNSVLLLTELRLTVYGNGWQAVLPIYGNGFRSGTSENQRLHKKLGNSEIGLHKDLGNSRTKKASLKQELVELRSQLKTERADQKEIEAKLCELKQNYAPAARLFKKLTLCLAIILSPLRAREKN